MSVFITAPKLWNNSYHQNKIKNVNSLLTSMLNSLLLNFGTVFVTKKKSWNNFFHPQNHQ